MKFFTFFSLILLFGSFLHVLEASSGRQQLIEAIRRWVNENQAQFDAADVADLLHGPEAHVTRYIDFLGSSGDLNKILKLLVDDLKWRKSIGLSKLRAEDFPCEFWLAGPLQLTAGRESGEPVLSWDFRSMGTYQGGLRTGWYAFLEYQFALIDRKVATSNGTATQWKLTGGLDGAGLANMADVKGLIDHFAPIISHYAGLLQRIYVLPLPSLVQSMARMLINMAPERTQKAIRILQERERYFIVKKRDLPVNFGGTLPPSKGLMMIHFPGLMESCLPLKQVARQRHWSDESVKGFLRNVQHLIDYNAKQINFRRTL